jgi:hypothetical protein
MLWALKAYMIIIVREFLVQGVAFIVSMSTAALSHKRYASAEASRCSCGPQERDKTNSVFNRLWPFRCLSCFFCVALRPYSDLGCSVEVYRRVTHTHTHTVGLPLDEWLAGRRGRYLQNTQETNIHALSGIRTRDTSIRAAVDLLLVNCTLVDCSLFYLSSRLIWTINGWTAAFSTLHETTRN